MFRPRRARVEKNGMSNRKNYNSIVFLTTLSVYLGLVLAGGATPSVLAQAALTRDFDIKNEVVLEDDLDKKPDDEEKTDFNYLLKAYYTGIEQLTDNLIQAYQSGYFDFDKDPFNVKISSEPSCGSSCYGPIRSVSGDSRLRIFFVLGEYSRGLTRIQLDSCEQAAELIDTVLDITYNPAELQIKISTIKSSPQKADRFIEAFSQVIGLYKIDDKKIFLSKIHENTSVKAENNQVFIVTRLPRASIDAFPAEK